MGNIANALSESEIKTARGLSSIEMEQVKSQYPRDRIIAIWKDETGKTHVRMSARTR